ncbi:prepilin-type N-terminal cleavage/methylation domain-containing protein [Shewanella maritima]|uniref:Prepilin-type N-terminal cleavage/methylation domain-containing protein n=1 Tax=Shewanella maritima TaxID=2520507 RepID=A0A411PGP5_9GAMM|nr:prepilin-type N-terminal cleavage/methylation domain-containing protein [Shewanella maritima]QBF82779.1 prepilin-type N-terminal cleavage/methylation domain-containing protein [Shewanella maritima]
MRRTKFSLPVIKNLGFTLVEMVTVILILGILVVGVSSFIIFGTRIFIESSSVDQVLSQSRYGVERLTRDLRNAVPNSVRLLTDGSGLYQCIEFVPIKSSSSYLNAPIAPDPVAGSMSVFRSATAIDNGDQVMLYPLTASEVYNPTGTTAKRFRVQSTVVTGDQVTVNFASNIRFTEDSPLQRVYFAVQPVSYCFIRASSSVDAELVRYQNYGYQTSQPAPGNMGTGVLMAQNVTNAFAIEPALIVTPSNLVTNALVHVQPRFSVNGETFKYQHQIQVINVP